MQIAANIGNSGKPRPGQRHRGESRRLNDFAAIGKINEPWLVANLDTEPGRCATALRRRGQAGSEVFLEIAKTGFSCHLAQGSAAIRCSNSSGLSGLTR